MPRIAFGPIAERETWRSIGFDVARELSRYFDVELFRDFESAPSADAIVCVHQPPPEAFLNRVRSRIVYAPVDYFTSLQHISEHSAILKRCALLLVHCRRLLPILSPYAPVANVELHTRFTLPQMPPYRREGFILWVGHVADLPWLLAEIQRKPLPLELRIISKLYKRPVQQARSLADKLGVDFALREDRIGPYKRFSWNERLQSDMMRECKAAVDVKGGEADFRQFTMPAVKIQKYLTSGIPAAVNPDSYSAEFCKAMGFAIASPADHERWFSEDYANEVREFGAVLREKLSLQKIAMEYRNLLDIVLSTPKVL